MNRILAKIEQVLNALAFANARNRREFEALLAARRVPAPPPAARRARAFASRAAIGRSHGDRTGLLRSFPPGLDDDR